MTDTMADTVHERRKSLGLSRERVAAQLEPPVTSKTLERWEKSKTPIPGWRALQLLAVYDAYEGVAA